MESDTIQAIEVFEMSEEDKQESKDFFQFELKSMSLYGPKRFVLPHRYKDFAPHIYNMPLKKGDIFVSSFPRSGTTLTQELVWLINKDLDYTNAKAISLTERYTFLELSLFLCKSDMQKKLSESNNHDEEKIKLAKRLYEDGLELLRKDTSSPRFIKTHLPMSLLPPKLLDTAKMVYIARDPRDVAVSYFFLKKMKSPSLCSDFKAFWKPFIHNLLDWTPYFENIKEAWKERNHPNMLFIFYEEMSKDLPKTLRRVMEFFGKEYNEEQIAGLVDHLSIEIFKTNESVNFSFLETVGLVFRDSGFIRKGKTGGWRDYFDEEMTLQADRWIADNLRDTDFRFPHMEKQ